MSPFRSVAVLATLALASACQTSGNEAMSDAARSQVEAEVRAAADAVISGFNRGDPAPYLDQLTDNQIYVENLMMYPSVDSVRGAVNQFMSSGMSVKMEWTGEPKVIGLGPDLGVFSSTMRESLTDASGANSIVDAAWTAVYQRLGGSWKIIAAHESTVAPPSEGM